RRGPQGGSRAVCGGDPAGARGARRRDGCGARAIEWAARASSPHTRGHPGAASGRCRQPKCGRGWLTSRHLVDADGRGEDQRVVLSGRDLDPVGVADPEPALGDLRDLVPVALVLVLVIDYVAFGPALVVVFVFD